MPRIRARSLSSPPSHWLPALLVGAALGATVSWLILREDEPESEAVGADAALERTRPLPMEPRAPRQRKRGHGEPDLDALTAVLANKPGAEQLRVRSLGQGIVELVGNAGAALDVAELIRSLALEPRVTVVVNRVWTAGSVASGPLPASGDS